MFTQKMTSGAAGVSLAALISLTARPLHAQASSESARLEKLERAVELLEKQNAELDTTLIFVGFFLLRVWL